MYESDHLIIVLDILSSANNTFPGVKLETIDGLV